jgi:glutaminase
MIEIECSSLMFEGKNADYIAPLAEVPAGFAMAFVSVEGEVFQTLDDTRFSVQSITKVFALNHALRLFGDRVWVSVGGNASGLAFNDSTLLDSEAIPRNPCINAGALSVSALLARKSSLDELLAELSALSGEPAIVDPVVASGEYADCDNNRLICKKLHRNGVILDTDSEDILWFYCRQCAIRMNCVQIARCLLPLANQGMHNGTRMLGSDQVAAVNAVLLTAGTYDNAGIVLKKIGAPAKSGVGGGVAAIYPGHGVACAWSPRLDRFGNSVAAQAALSRFTARMGWSILI